MFPRPVAAGLSRAQQRLEGGNEQLWKQAMISQTLIVITYTITSTVADEC